MKERLLILLENYKLSSAQFAELIGVQRSSISHILSGRNKPSYDFLVKIIEHFDDLNTEWLLIGQGHMLKKQVAQKESSNTHDLFTKPDEIKPKSPFNGPKKEDTALEESNPIISEVLSDSLAQDSSKTGEVTNVNKVKMLIFVYEDNSFEIINKK